MCLHHFASLKTNKLGKYDSYEFFIVFPGDSVLPASQGSKRLEVLGNPYIIQNNQGSQTSAAATPVA